MKRYLPLLMLLGCLAACARIIPRSVETAAGLPESVPEAPTPSAALSAEAEVRLRALLSEAAAHSGEGGTAGSSLRLFALAGKLLDWQAETGADALETEAAARSFGAGLHADARKKLRIRLKALSAAALALCAGETGALEDSGYLPRCQPWEQAAAAEFFAAVDRGLESEYSEEKSGKMNIFPLFPLREAEKFAMIQQK